MTKSSGNRVNYLGSQQWFELKCVILQLVEKKLYLKLISRNKRSIDWLSKLIGRNKRSHDWLREIVIVTYYWLQLERGLLILQKNWKSWYDSRSRKQCVIEFKCRKIPRIAQKQKKNPRKQCMIEFKHRELPKIAQKQILFLNRSQIIHSLMISWST